MKLDLAQYRELEAFAKFGSDLDKSTQRTIAKGARLVELLKQGQYAPVPVEKQVVAIYYGTRGFMDEIAVKDVKRFEKGVLEFIEVKYKQIFDSIKKIKTLVKKLMSYYRKLEKNFFLLSNRN